MAFDPASLILFGAGVILAALVVRGMIPALMPLFRRYAMARPSARGSHSEPTPQGGGLPVVLAVVMLFLLAGLLGGLKYSPGEVTRYYILAVFASVAMAMLGAADDIRPMPARTRLVAQLVLSAVVVFAAPSDWRIAGWMPYWIERAGIVIAFVWMVNLTNFMDGIDAMVTVEAMPMMLAIGFIMAADVVSSEAGVIAAALAGGLLGFHRFNRHPAKVFLGDVGSLSIGFLLAAILFELASRNLAAALLLPLYFLADATTTLLLGLAAGHDVTLPHRRHAYQRALDLGMRVTAITARVLVLNVGLVALALAALAAGRPTADALTLAVGFVAVILVIRAFRKGHRA